MRIAVMVVSLLLSVPLTFAQQSNSPLQPSMPASNDAQNPDRQEILSVLDKYASAYDHQSMSELLAIWPTLKDDQKLYKHIEQHFRESNIMVNSVETTMEPEHWEIEKDRAVVRCVRNERYVKVATQAETIGTDLRGPKAGYGQLPEPNQRTQQWVVKKSSDVTLTLQKVGNDWNIVSGAEEKK